MFLPTLLDPESVDKVMEAKGQTSRTFVNDLWKILRPVLMPGNNRQEGAGAVVRTLQKYGHQVQDNSPLLVADYTGELPKETSLDFELCQYETCRQPATWRGFLELEGLIPVCNQCVVETEDPVMILGGHEIC